MDRLAEIFQAQSDLEIRLGYKFEEMSTLEKVTYIKEYSLHLEHELHEMLQELPYFKPWKIYETDAKLHHCVREELVDVFHLFLNLALAAGLTADELFSMYMAKNYTNHKRQDNVNVYKPCVER